MTWGAICRSVIGPALLIGPALGVLGAIALTAIAAILAIFDGGGLGGGPNLNAEVIYVAFSAALLGLMIASPICFVFWAIALRLAVRRAAWWDYPSWIALGIAPGFLIYASLAMAFSSQHEFVFVLGLSSVALAMVGAAWCRKMLSRPIEALVIAEMEEAF